MMSDSTNNTTNKDKKNTSYGACAGNLRRLGDNETLNIFKFLSVADKANLSSTCKSLRDSYVHLSNAAELACMPLIHDLFKRCNFIKIGKCSTLKNGVHVVNVEQIKDARPLPITNSNIDIAKLKIMLYWSYGAFTNAYTNLDATVVPSSLKTNKRVWYRLRYWTLLNNVLDEETIAAYDDSGDAQNEGLIGDIRSVQSQETHVNRGLAPIVDLNQVENSDHFWDGATNIQTQNFNDVVEFIRNGPPSLWLYYFGNLKCVYVKGRDVNRTTFFFRNEIMHDMMVRFRRLNGRLNAHGASTIAALRGFFHEFFTTLEKFANESEKNIENAVEEFNKAMKWYIEILVSNADVDFYNDGRRKNHETLCDLYLKMVKMHSNQMIFVGNIKPVEDAFVVQFPIIRREDDL
jgi:hypothetical protein